jgi:protease-4
MANNLGLTESLKWCEFELSTSGQPLWLYRWMK